MDKTIRWEAAEASHFQQIEQEKTQVLAQIGVLMMDLDTAKKSLDTINERHKAAIRQALSSRGINQFESARPFAGGVSLSILDSPSAPNGGA